MFRITCDADSGYMFSGWPTYSSMYSRSIRTAFTRGLDDTCKTNQIFICLYNLFVSRLKRLEAHVSLPADINALGDVRRHECDANANANVC